MQKYKLNLSLVNRKKNCPLNLLRRIKIYFTRTTNRTLDFLFTRTTVRTLDFLSRKKNLNFRPNTRPKMLVRCILFRNRNSSCPYSQGPYSQAFHANRSRNSSYPYRSPKSCWTIESVKVQIILPGAKTILIKPNILYQPNNQELVILSISSATNILQ